MHTVGHLQTCKGQFKTHDSVGRQGSAARGSWLLELPLLSSWPVRYAIAEGEEGICCLIVFFGSAGRSDWHSLLLYCFPVFRITLCCCCCFRPLFIRIYFHSSTAPGGARQAPSEFCVIEVLEGWS